MTEWDDDTTEALEKLSSVTSRYRTAVDAHAQLRQQLSASSQQVRHAQQVRDAAVRRARAAGLRYRELRAATGYSRSYLDRIVGSTPDTGTPDVGETIDGNGNPWTAADHDHRTRHYGATPE